MPRLPVVHALEVVQLRRTRSEVNRQVGDLLVAQVTGLAGHQYVLAVAGAIGLQGMRDGAGVLATQLRIARIDGCVAVDAMAVDAGLAYGRAPGFGGPP